MARHTRASAFPRPRVRPKTAYRVLSAVIRIIEADACVYNQHIALLIEPSWIDRRDLFVPACGTIGCVAGLTVMLLESNPRDVAGRWRVLPTASAWLGLSQVQADELFDLYAAGLRRYPSTRRLQRAYAARGIAHIRRFQQKYRAQLQRHRIPATLTSTITVYS